LFHYVETVRESERIFTIIGEETMKKTFIIVMLIALLAVTPVLAKSSMEN